jgi:hypothetical protein
MFVVIGHQHQSLALCYGVKMVSELKDQFVVSAAYVVMSCGYLMNKKLKIMWWTLDLSKSHTT